MAWPFLPVNPVCTASPVNQTTSNLLTYEGPILPCTGVESCQTLTEVFQRIDNEICILKQKVVVLENALISLSTTTTTSTAYEPPLGGGDCEIQGKITY